MISELEELLDGNQATISERRPPDDVAGHIHDNMRL